MILEGIVTTQNQDGSTNVSPMGPIVDADMETFVLRPFQTSTTYRNLKRSGRGIFHVTDDVLLLAQAAIGQLQSPRLVSCDTCGGKILADCCRWYAFDVESLDDREARTQIDCRVVQAGRIRDFFGFNRAKHAVVEAAILATRVHVLDSQDLSRQLDALRPLVEKTAGEQEARAFALLLDYVSRTI